MSSTGDTPTANAPVAADAARDPATEKLFRMSRTAGVGLQDYAAINPLAVAGLLLGLLSFLAIMVPESLAILIVPAAAIVVSILAFVQVRKSNGTQTGQLLALAGLALAVVLAGINVVGHARTAAFESSQKKELDALATKLLGTATTQQAESTYALFDERFREAVPLETFQRTMQAKMQLPVEPKTVTQAGVGDYVVFESDDAGNVVATALLRLSGDLKYPTGETFYIEEPATFVRRVGEPWRFQSIAGWFGKTNAPAAQRR